MELKKGNTFYGQENYVSQVGPTLTVHNVTGEDDKFLPVSGGRSSQPTNVVTFAPTNKLNSIPPDFAVEYLEALEHLAAYNSDISYALDNIVHLANTPHEVYFSDKVPKKKQLEMRLHLKLRESAWYEFSGGERSLKADLLTQVVINGALSAEVVPNDKLTGVEQVIRVAPKYIRFVYNNQIDRYEPYQAGSRMIQNTDLTGMIKLNTTKYRYIALRRYFETPYATPPFISAIEALCTQKDMLSNFKNIIQKLGMLGFLSAEVSPPSQLPGEDKNAYFQRCVDYLNNTVYPQLNKNLSKGMVAGFKDSHKFTLQGNNMNVQGAEGLFKLIQSRIFAGVKQDPNMLGENYSTTETFGRVILAKMLSQVGDYQTVVDKFFEHLYLIELRLAGFSPGYVEVKSEPPMISDKSKEEEARTKQITNVKTVRDMGIISQETAANELGYDKPDSDGDITAVTDPNNNDGTSGDGTAPSGKKTDPNNEPNAGTAENIAILEARLKAHVTEYDYGVGHNCNSIVSIANFENDFNFGDKKLEKFARKYFNSINAKYKDAAVDVATMIGKKLLNYSTNTALEAIQRDVYFFVLAHWESKFISKIKEDIQSNVANVYDYYRKDKSIFPKESTQSNSVSFAKNNVPNAVLDLDDYKTIDYMERSDSMYLGKFITDEDTKRAIYTYIEDNYIGGYLPIGNNEAALKQFNKQFGDTIKLEAWKIRRIIDTSVNKLRNYAQVHYLDQAMVDEFEIIEINDNLTCDYCSQMDGKVFSVTTAKNKIQRETNNAPENVSTISPFITNLKIDEVKSMSADELQNAGYDVPPYHCHCRGMTAAHFS